MTALGSKVSTSRWIPTPADRPDRTPAATGHGLASEAGAALGGLAVAVDKPLQQLKPDGRVEEEVAVGADAKQGDVLVRKPQAQPIGLQAT